MDENSLLIILFYIIFGYTLRSSHQQSSNLEVRSLMAFFSSTSRAILRRLSSNRYALTPGRALSSSAVDTSGYHVSGGPSFMRGTVFWEPNKPLTIEDFHMPRPKSGEVLIKTKGQPSSINLKILIKVYRLMLFKIFDRNCALQCSFHQDLCFTIACFFFFFFFNRQILSWWEGVYSASCLSN